MKPDDKFQQFLQEYRPDLPPSCPNQESLLMARIAETEQLGTIPWTNVIAIGTAIVGLSLTLGWFLDPPRRLASNAINSLDLEAFLVDTWSGSIHGETVISEHPLNEQWVSLINP